MPINENYPENPMLFSLLYVVEEMNKAKTKLERNNIREKIEEIEAAARAAARAAETVRSEEVAVVVVERSSQQSQHVQMVVTNLRKTPKYLDLIDAEHIDFYTSSRHVAEDSTPQEQASPETLPKKGLWERIKEAISPSKSKPQQTSEPMHKQLALINR